MKKSARKDRKTEPDSAARAATGRDGGKTRKRHRAAAETAGLEPVVAGATADQASKPARSVQAGMTGAEALASFLRAGAAEYDRQRALVLETADPEPTHKARVALRRMRAILGGFAPILSQDGLKSLQRDLRQAFRAFGPLRDADVRAEEFADTPAADAHRAAAAALRDELRARLSDPAAQTLTAQLDTRLADPRFWRKGGAGRRLGDAPAQVAGQRAMHEAWTAMLAFGDDLSALSIEDRHEFRKDAKSMRYLSEAFRPLWPGDPAKGFLSRMTKLQDALGIMNDIAGFRAHAEAQAGDDADAETTDDAAPHLPDDLDARESAAAKAAQKGWDRLRDKGPWWAGSAAG